MAPDDIDIYLKDSSRCNKMWLFNVIMMYMLCMLLWKGEFVHADVMIDDGYDVTELMITEREWIWDNDVYIPDHMFVHMRKEMREQDSRFRPRRKRDEL